MTMYYYSKQKREKRLCESRGRLYLSILLDNKKKGGTRCFSVDVAQIGWTMNIYVYLIVSVSTLFYVFHCSVN